MVRPISGCTENGDKYRIVGGKSYVKENNCYDLIYYRMADRIEEIWNIPSNNLSISDLEHKLQGPLEIYGDKPPYGREFLVELVQKPKYQERFSADAFIF